MGATSWRFWFGSTEEPAISMRCPLWSLTVNPENLATRSSVKVSRISFGDGAVASCPGSVLSRTAWAWAVPPDRARQEDHKSYLYSIAQHFFLLFQLDRTPSSDPRENGVSFDFNNAGMSNFVAFPDPRSSRSGSRLIVPLDDFPTGGERAGFRWRAGIASSRFMEQP